MRRRAAVPVRRTGGVPAEFLDIDDPQWCDDRADLAGWSLSRGDLDGPGVRDAVLTLARMKRMTTALHQWTLENGWVTGGRWPRPDTVRLAAAGVPDTSARARWEHLRRLPWE